MATDAKRFYPVFLDLYGRLAVIVGGGAPALRKAKQLASYGADVIVVSATTDPLLAEAEADGVLTYEHRGYVRGDLAEAFIALCVDPDPELQRAVRDEAESVGCLLNVLGVPDWCSFIVPSVVNREPLQIAVSTGGVAPGLAKQVRREISAQFGSEYAEYARLLGEVREQVFSQVESGEEREAILAAVGQSDLLDRLKAGEHPTAATLFEQFSTGTDTEGDAT
ncbi:MAG: siroheme synthase [Actinobacteria bacterium HGW-Actinobacteria-7]|jgi:siroheme synthase-like protein|nr:MAG: siroheme synthase [Actinobacteria bacterium HGW-Actinobacteria-7]